MAKPCLLTLEFTEIHLYDWKLCKVNYGHEKSITTLDNLRGEWMMLLLITKLKKKNCPAILVEVDMMKASCQIIFKINDCPTGETVLKIIIKLDIKKWAWH